MSAILSHLPAAACVHFHQGRCLYEERLNPGLHQAWRCVVWREWEEDFDAFLNRAEAFALEEGEAGRLWARRQARLLAAARTCPEFVPGGAEPVGCGRGQDLLCLDKLPVCAGRCPNYRTGCDCEGDTHAP